MKQSLNNGVFPTNHSLSEILARQAQQSARQRSALRLHYHSQHPLGSIPQDHSAAQPHPSHHPSYALPSQATPLNSIVTGRIHTSWKDRHRYSSLQPEEHEDTLNLGTQTPTNLNQLYWTWRLAYFQNPWTLKPEENKDNKVTKHPANKYNTRINTRTYNHSKPRCINFSVRIHSTRERAIWHH